MTTPDDLVTRLGRWSAGRGPLYLLLAGRIRRLIDDGELPPGSPLPPDRTLAAALAVGRTTVVSAYDLLTQEGKIVRRQGSGTKVAPAALRPDRPADAANPLFMHLLEPLDKIVQLTCAAPNVMPAAVTEAYTKALSVEVTDDIGYHPLGYSELRCAIAGRFTARGLPTGPGQILVTTGAQQALALLARLFVSPGDKVVVERPTYPGALEAFRESTADFVPVPHGDADALSHAMRERPAAVYVIPTHHNPTGSVMSPLTRQRLAGEAVDRGVRLIEDEVLADLSFDGDLPLPIAAYGPAVTIGSLSKVIWGGLRIGWVRASESVIMRLARLKAVHDLGSNYIGQVAAVSLVSSLESLRAARSSALRAQHAQLCTSLREHLPEWEFTPASGGQSLWVKLPYGDAISYAQLALRHGVAVLPGGSLDATGASTQYLRIPFLETAPVLATAVVQLAKAWREYVPGTASASLTTLVV
ncbi:DNA-binding transcriptional regulator, MocR family, contains an aminotransferase domain [Kibdelosporangium sp. 4NS15]|uniref:DNA-binding transcriptional regulator, MocR family, contains an aminotransferase domain n=1 Tax=Kibdelosporangium persicum TaxID=2698649 RepID=A0ABX2FDH5_9PSEU|nr:PLP-dependent aminotransferase family protein [Kibdelosporangium persicum]NRN68960.1 DNA-binding transcriptional regulator, MocR family, contains an aminotransferase domain [Kibdelosporangium persicum]